ncbi:DUF5658 family protein [Dethiobacter alkaliphilus]|uniref:DUF5658 domain-containing protein n=1 Tax=Dethiobacter alkaliphilus AHT 1 TaxID=555088 RepID=C0GEE9_DETAL|nr:DUF5658 family protein [Dethiobacter alkaliphilus]EEG78443.1 conserved hypothetical protein [Dethiobacter alkaliphilus AHT 1]
MQYICDENNRFRLIGLMLICVAFFNAADYFLTLHALSLGFREGNPVMALIVDTAYFPKVKLIIVPLLLLFLWLVRVRVGRRLFGYVSVIFAAYSLLMVYYGFLFLTMQL